MGAIIEPFLYIIGLLVDIYFKIVVVQVVLADSFQNFGTFQ